VHLWVLFRMPILITVFCSDEITIHLFWAVCQGVLPCFFDRWWVLAHFGLLRLPLSTSRSRTDAVAERSRSKSPLKRGGVQTKRYKLMKKRIVSLNPLSNGAAFKQTQTIMRLNKLSLNPLSNGHRYLHKSVTLPS
jgi:hypothetical protein